MGNDITTTGPGHFPPSLARAMNTAGVFYPTDEITSVGPGELETVLHQVYQLLRMGLQDAWGSSEGRGDFPERVLSSAPNPLAEMNEQWAQVVAEKLLFLPYLGPNNYGYGDDRVFYRKIVDVKDSAYPIVACCQQHTNMALLARGFDQLVEAPVDASSAKNVENFGGKSVTSNELEPARKDVDPRAVSRAFHNSLNAPLLPGSCYVKKGGVDHICFVIRTFGDDDTVVQLFDTKGMGPCEPELQGPKALASRLDGGLYDYGLNRNIPRELKHWGMVPAPDPDNFRKAIQRMRDARPLGFARLVLRDRASKKVLFATPLLLMYTNVYSLPIARYLWSLRWLGGRQTLEALWLIYMTTREIKKSGEQDDTALTVQLVYPETGRGTTLSQMVQKVRELKKKPDWNPVCGGDYICITILASSPDIVKNQENQPWSFKKGSFDQGNVIVLHRYGNFYNPDTKTTTQTWQPDGDPMGNLKTLPWDRPTYGKGYEKITGLKWDSFPYLKGDWDPPKANPPNKDANDQEIDPTTDPANWNRVDW